MSERIPPGPFEPDYAVPPGATIEETVLCKAWEEFYKATGLNNDQVGELLEGRLQIDQALAEKLGAHLGQPASYWLTAEKNYRATLERLRDTPTSAGPGIPPGA